MAHISRKAKDLLNLTILTCLVCFPCIAIAENSLEEQTGIGIALDPIAQPPTIIAVGSMSAAEKAGIQRGDRIKKIDGSNAAHLGEKQVYTALLGNYGSTVVLTVERQSKVLEIPVKRLSQKLNEISFSSPDRHPEIAVFKFLSFWDATLMKFRNSAGTFVNAKGIIIDLRGNLGGRIDSINELLNVFLPQNSSAYKINAYGEAKVVTMDKNPIFPQEIPITILIDSNTAAGAELVAGVLREQRNALLIGEQTQGREEIAEQYHDPFSNSFNKTVTGTFSFINNTPIGKVGIAPDIVIRNTRGIDKQFRYAVSSFKRAAKKKLVRKSTNTTTKKLQQDGIVTKIVEGRITPGMDPAKMPKDCTDMTADPSLSAYLMVLRAEYLYGESNSWDSIVADAMKKTCDLQVDRTVKIIETIAQTFGDYVTSKIIPISPGLADPGILVDVRDDVLQIVGIVQNGAGFVAGLKTNDSVLTINGNSVAGMSAKDVMQSLQGAEGVPVKIGIQRQGNIAEISVIRKSFSGESYNISIQSDTPIVQIYRIIPSLRQKLRLALIEIMKQNPKGIIVDLRDVYGMSDEDSLQELASIFLPENSPYEILHERTSTRTLLTPKFVAPIFPTGFRIGVLVNGGTSGAAEVLASALQESGVGIIIGTKSMGHSDAVVKLYGALQYVVAKRMTIHSGSLAAGIEPNIHVETNDKKDSVLEEALNFIKVQ